ncbi:hypothetical protein CDAR_171081, partial [Caerostris darwini]
MEYPHMQDSDTSGSVGDGILNAGDLRVNAVTVSSETITVDLLPSSNDSDGVSKIERMSLNDFFDRVTNAMEVSSEVNVPAEVHLDLTVPPNADANASTTVTPEGMCR